jgi:hypothetical protein
MAETESELQIRTCRSCGHSYKYPVVKSRATRFFCEACMELKPEVRSTFEKYNKRIRDLTRQVKNLEARLSGESKTLREEQ